MRAHKNNADLLCVFTDVTNTMLSLCENNKTVLSQYPYPLSKQLERNSKEHIKVGQLIWNLLPKGQDETFFKNFNCLLPDKDIINTNTPHPTKWSIQTRLAQEKEEQWHLAH